MFHSKFRFIWLARIFKKIDQSKIRIAYGGHVIYIIQTSVLMWRPPPKALWRSKEKTKSLVNLSTVEVGVGRVREVRLLHSDGLSEDSCKREIIHVIDCTYNIYKCSISYQ